MPSRVGRAAGLAAVAFLFWYFLQQPFPFQAKVFAALFLLVSVARPDTGLLVFAGLAPLSSAIAGLCGGGAGLGAQLLEQMALGVGAGVLVRPLEPTRTRIGPPALLMAVVAAASAAAVMPAIAAPLTRDMADGLILAQLAVRPAVVSSPWAPLFAALVVAECGFLGWAVERIVRQTPALGRRLIAIALIGQAGSSALTLLALLSGALRTGDVLGALPGLLMSVRINLQTDVHAAASSLVLAGIAGIALGSGSRTRAFGVSVLLALISLGLWITASRVALVLGVVTTLAVIGWLIARTRRTPRWVIAAIAILALGAGSVVAFKLLNPAARNGSIERSASARLVLAEAGLKMFQDMPVFGIGIGRFYAVSPRYLGSSLGENYRENAHNNFLQVLAEQGLVGFIALIWWLSVIVIGGIAAQRSSPTIDRGCLLAAIVACLGTWITGHPLLVAEFAFVFWLYCGILSAGTPNVPNVRPWLLLLLVAGIIGSVPSRASTVRDAADLEYQGFGLSLWQHDDTQRYREVGDSFALFLPATGRPSKVPLRRVSAAPEPLIVEVSISGRPIQTVSVSGEAWQDVLIVVPSGSRRFERVDFVVRPQTGITDVTKGMLRVGKTEAP